MNQPLRILIVEDSEADALLLVRVLQKGGYDPAYERVETADAMGEALGREAWDVIISDYRMPHFSGLGALKLYKEKGLDIPFIIVSGAIGEETAVAAISSGAHDYVMKDHLSRLVPAIQRELENAGSRRERKKSEEELNESKVLIETIVENIPLMIFLKEATDLRFVIFNRAGEELLGYDRRDLIGKNNLDLFPPEQAAHFTAKDREVLDGEVGMLDIPEEPILTAKKGQRLLHTRKICIKGPDGVTKFLLGISDDITDRKYQENERELKVRLLETANTSNDFWKILSELTLFLQSWSGCEAVGIRLRAGDDYPYYETRGFPPAFIQAENHLCACDYDGKILRDGAGNPIHECMCGNILCGRFDPDKPFFTVQGSFWSNNTTALLSSTTETDRQARTRNRCNGEGYESVALIPLRTKNQVFGLLQFNDHRTDRFTPGLIAHFERIADILAIALSRRQAEEEIQNSEAFLNRLIEQSPMAMWISDDQGNLIRLNQACCDLLNITAEEVIGRYNIFQDNIVKEQGFLPHVKAVFEHGETARFEIDYNSSHVEGLKLQRTAAVILDVTIFPIQDIHGRITHAVIQDRDITEQRQAEEALRKSAEMLRLISENMSDMIRVTDLQGNNIYASPSHFKCLGYKPEERVGKPGFDIVHPDDVEMVINKFAKGLTGKQSRIKAEYRAKHKDGHYIWLETIGDLLWDAQGNPLNVIMSSRDITERKQTEALLCEREELFRSFFENAVETMFLTAPDGRIMAANPAACAMFGWTEQEFIKGGRNLLVDVTDPRFDILLKERLEKGNAHGVLTYLRRDGTKFQGEVTSAIYKDKDGNQKSSIIIRDITERLRALDAIKNSEKKYRLLHESMMDGFVSVDMNGKFLECNEIYRNMLGYSKTELAALTYADVTPEKWHASEADIVLNQILKRGYSDVYEKEYRRKNGTIFPVELHTVLIRDEQQKPLYMWAIARDITERKQSEEKLAHLRQQDELILSSAAEGILGLDLQGNHTFVNPAAARMLGYKIEELLGHPSHSTWHHTKPDGSPFPADECRIYASYLVGAAYHNSTEVFWRKDGTCFPVEYASTPIHEKDHLAGTVVTFMDITDRKQAEKELKQTVEKLRKSLSGTIQAISSMVEIRDPYTAGHEKRVSMLARAIARELGLPTDVVDNIRMAASIHDIGKISIPAEILSKPGRLSDIEMKLIQMHSQTGYDILKDVDFSYPIAKIVLQHHERLNGSGYPQGIKIGEILFESRIVSVADVVEAMASHRPYRPALGIDMALEEIEKNKGIFYDATVVDACVRLFREKGFKLE